MTVKRHVPWPAPRQPFVPSGLRLTGTPAYRVALVEQIARDMAVLREPTYRHVPSTAFYEKRIRQFRVAVHALSRD
jgi:hypothetical protein